MDRDALARVEEVLRLLASAANAARLYPPSSALPAQAIERFVSASVSASTGAGPLRLTVEPHGFRIDEIPVGSEQTHTVGLAEQLHALQVGQFMIAPDVNAEETAAFLGILNRDAREVRQSGGFRAALGAAGVTRLAVIEVTLRASDEQGIMGLDLAGAPLEDIARETEVVARTWVESAREGEGRDDMAAALDRMEEATREVAERRVAEALLRLDEETRAKLVAAAFIPDANRQRMQGMFDVIGSMQPAALAKLLTIAAAQLGVEPDRLLPALDLPPEVLRDLVALITAPSQSEEERGVPPAVDVEEMAQDVAAEEPTSDLDRQIAVALPALASGRALSTAVAVAREHSTEEAVQAIGEALPKAARDGVFAQTSEALRLLGEFADDPALSEAVALARGRLAEPEVLADVVEAPLTDADAAVVGEIVSAAGQPGVDALMACYVRADTHSRELLRPVLRGVSEQVLGAASRMLRASEGSSVALVQVLPALGDRRALTVLEQALDQLDADVRLAAVTALAEIPEQEAREALVKTVTHWDPQTARFAVREIGRIRAEEALPALLRQLEEINLFERKHELKKEIISSLQDIGSPTAVPALRRVAGNRLAFGRKNRELRYLASRAVSSLTPDEDGGRRHRLTGEARNEETMHRGREHR